MKFQTIAQIRRFLQNQNIQFRGIYEHYRLADGRLVTFKDKSTSNTWGLRNEATEMVEVGA